jgi:hypothetical protein
MNRTKVLLTLCGLSLLSISASAKPVLWTLTNVQFADYGTATGSFVYDADTKEYSAIDITTAGGSVRSGATYTVQSDTRSNAGSALFETMWAENQTGLPGLVLFYFKPLPDEGGSVVLANGLSLEMTCSNANCGAYGKPQRAVIGGSLEGTPIVGCLIDPNPTKLGCGGVTRPSLTSLAAAPNGGFWVQVDGRKLKNTSSGTLAIGGAPQFENVADAGVIAAIPGQNSYFVVNDKGHIYSRGGAPVLCGGELSNCSGFKSSKDDISSAAATPDGQGLWAATASGKVYTAGTAQTFGDQQKQSSICVTILATPSGKGYYLLFSDGGIFSFGDAKFHGSTGGKRPGGKDVRGLAASLDLNGNLTGYWMVAVDGGVFSFDAPFLGSTGGNNNGHDITDITALPNGHEYAWVTDDGQVTVSATQTFNNVSFTNEWWQTVMTAPEGGQAGTPLTLTGNYGTANQQWNLVPTSDDGQLLRLVNVENGLCANLTQNGNNLFVIQYTCQPVPQNNERFRLISDLAGHIQLAPANLPSERIWATGSGTIGLIDPNQQDPKVLNWTLAQSK